MSVTDSFQTIVLKIKCCMTDWDSVNHLTISLLEEEWGTKLIELNCNLHPLEVGRLQKVR